VIDVVDLFILKPYTIHKKFIFSVSGQGVDIWRSDPGDAVIRHHRRDYGRLEVGNAIRFSRTQGVTTASPG
jgi:hypothetical protein